MEKVSAERFATSYTHGRMNDDKPYKYCSRSRCNNKMIVVLVDGSYMLPYESIVISLNGGDRKYSYCCMKCASTDLATMAKKEQK